MSVSSCTGLPGLSRTNAVKRLCVCVLTIQKRTEVKYWVISHVMCCYWEQFVSLFEMKRMVSMAGC